MTGEAGDATGVDCRTPSWSLALGTDSPPTEAVGPDLGTLNKPAPPGCPGGPSGPGLSSPADLGPLQGAAQPGLSQLSAAARHRCTSRCGWGRGEEQLARAGRRGGHLWLLLELLPVGSCVGQGLEEWPPPVRMWGPFEWVGGPCSHINKYGRFGGGPSRGCRDTDFLAPA